MLGGCGLIFAGRVNGENGNSTGLIFLTFLLTSLTKSDIFGCIPFGSDVKSSWKTSVDVLQRQVISLTEQVRTMSQSYEELIEGKDQRTGISGPNSPNFVRWIRIKELRERNRNGLIFLPFETLHQKVLMEGTFGPGGVYAQIIDHPSVTRLDRFILADVFISNEMNDHFTIGAVFIQSFWIIIYE